MSASMPGCARSTRARCSACAPVMDAVASSHCSAIQRRRVIDSSSLRPWQPVYSFRINTEGSALSAPLSVAFYVGLQLLLLRGLLYGFLRGLLCRCLLGCFLGCHLPILPFRWVASISAIRILQLKNV